MLEIAAFAADQLLTDEETEMYVTYLLTQFGPIVQISLNEALVGTSV